MKTKLIPIQAFYVNEKPINIEGSCKSYIDVESVRKDFGEKSEIFKDLVEFGASGLLTTPFILVLI